MMNDHSVAELYHFTTKCIPYLLNGLEVCPFTKAELHSLDFAVTGVLMKLFSDIQYCCCKNTAVDALAFNCRVKFLENRSRSLCPDITVMVDTQASDDSRIRLLCDILCCIISVRRECGFLLLVSVFVSVFVSTNALMNND